MQTSWGGSRRRENNFPESRNLSLVERRGNMFVFRHNIFKKLKAKKVYS